LFFQFGGRSFSCTAVFGINIKDAVKGGCQVHAASTGNQSSQEIRNVMSCLRRH
jgi:hypothetical protein